MASRSPIRFTQDEVPSCHPEGDALSLLTPQQVVQLTGRKKKSQQVQWLKDNKIPHYVSASGYPQVFESLVPAKHLGEFELGEVE